MHYGRGRRTFVGRGCLRIDRSDQSCPAVALRGSYRNLCGLSCPAIVELLALVLVAKVDD